ncbi:MAG: Trk system potassium transporter TrkA [Proteobacteria bacterium]|nr:Trk system potassium transporter TrkA [Pseudomonadota bacterium]
MKIVVAGAGEVGYHLIENLSRENLEILVVDNNAEVLEKLRSEYDVKTDHANIIDSKYLTKAHLADADLFLAITNSDETNMVACKAASEAGANKTICRIRQIDLSTEKKQFSLQSLGIDWIINPVSLVANELFKLVLTPNIVDNHEFSNGDITLTGYKIRQHAKILNRAVGELEEELRRNSFHIGIIQRKDMSIIPKKDEVIQQDDVVYFFYKTENYQLLRKILSYGKADSKSRRVFVNGGGHMGLRLAQRLEEAKQNVKVIEKDVARSFHIAEKLNKTLVLNFDGTDLKQLTTEGIENADYFISVTDNEQVNLTSCLLACEQGVERTICLVKQPELIPILDQNTPISLGISPRILTARHLVRFIQDTNVYSYFSLVGSHIEVLEFRLDDCTPCLDIPLKELELPENVRIGIIQRGDKCLLPTGDAKLMCGDTVLLILHRLDRDKAMMFFQSQSS